MLKCHSNSGRVGTLLAIIPAIRHVSTELIPRIGTGLLLYSGSWITGDPDRQQIP